MPGPAPQPEFAPALAAALARGATLLTAGERAARRLRNAFDRERLATGTARWTPPDIFALNGWMDRAWHQLLLAGEDDRLLVNATQEHALWLAVLDEDEDAAALRSLDSVAALAADAWAALLAANGLNALGRHAQTADTRAFARWAARMERMCRRDRLLTRAALPSALEQAAARIPLGAGSLVLVDVPRLPSAQAALMEALARNGWLVEQLRTVAPAEQAHVHAAQDEAGELQALAVWVQQERQLGRRVRIVTASLADRRAVLERCLDTACPPGEVEFSLGNPLAQTSPAAHALNLLRWASGPLPLDAISALLGSACFGGRPGSAAALALAELDAYELRRSPMLRPEMALADFAALLEHSRRKPRLGTLPPRVAALRRERASVPPGPHPYGRWAESFRAMLEAAGWMEAVAADAYDRQVGVRLEGALDELATLDFSDSRVDDEEALAALEHICRASLFTPRSHDAPVQVTGAHEDATAPADSVWFLGADDLSWPARQSLHPLVPWSLGHALGMPGTDAARELAEARALTADIAASAPVAVFSYAQHHQDEQRRISPALAGLALLPHAAVPSPLPERQDAESFADTVPVPALGDLRVRGGARVLELQAACAFRAFAEIRLFSTAPDSRAEGLGALERGSLVHTVMQRFWQQVGTQEALAGMPHDERLATLEDAIAGALTEAAHVARNAWDRAYLDVEAQRLAALLAPWLELELARPGFAVLAQEEAAVMRLGPLELNLRVDRVDETAAGALILDYKTGAASPKDWCGPRPDAPQLPLYAVHRAEGLAGIAFAVLKAGNALCLDGAADSPDVLAKPRSLDAPSFVEQVEQWRAILTALAEEFAANPAPRPAPKRYPKTCTRCGQRMLCRLDPARLAVETQEDALG